MVKSLSRDRNICRYQQVDLHVHSPASTDYRGDVNVSAYEFVSAFAQRGTSLIAITDHNTGSYVDQAIQARDQLAKEKGKNITVLPGVEMHVSPGVHLLAILPTGGSAAITDLLSYLGLHIDGHGDTDALISKPISEIADSVHQRGGILIGAHCNSTKGVVDVLQGQTRLEWLGALDALEISSKTSDDKIDKDINYVSNIFPKHMPFIFSSDSHDCTVETTGMWVKIAEPTLASLRQLVFEPELRVSRVAPAPPSHGRVVGFTTTHGIYADERFRFSPHLNVLLGGRGAGKSAALDLLRFVFEAEPKPGDKNSEVFTDRIMGFLQSVGEVLLVAIGVDGGTYVITRTGGYEKPHARATTVFTDPAKVYQVASDQLLPRDMRPQDVLSIEFYGQGEVAQLANHVDEQMRLIDENLDHSDAYALIKDAEGKLDSGEERLIERKSRLEDLRVEIASLADLEERRTQLAESLDDPIFKERTRWDREYNWIKGQQDWVEGLLDSLPKSVQSPPQSHISFEESSVKYLLEKVHDTSSEVLENSQSKLTYFREVLAEAMSELAKLLDEWSTAFEVAENRFRARLIELGITDRAEAAAEQRGIEEKIERIQTKVKPEVKQVKLDIKSLEDCRVMLLSQLRDARTSVSNSRADFIKELNGKLRGDVVVDLSGEETSQYFDALDSPLQGSGILHRENQISLVCKQITPERFVEIMRTGSIEQLMQIGITENNAIRMRDRLSDEILYGIERVDVPKLPSIRIKREGESDYTELSSLSVGEKCSAILSIALLSKGKPLVIDQPEDDLDHAFIIDSIVEGVRTAKSGRQIVTATHNPNIPVLGDAEMIFRVSRLPGKDVCHIQNSGGLDLPLITAQVQILEGGAEAFERRRRRYSGVS